jgi:hypothetical protein
MSAPAELVYDPDSVFAVEFSNPTCAADLAFALSCREVNVLAGQLAHHGWHESAELWLTHHAPTCEDPRRHQN